MGTILPAIVLLCLLMGLLGYYFVSLIPASTVPSMPLDKARALFKLRREWLEADFVNLASNFGKPRGLAWKDCDFGSNVEYARDPESGELCAFVEVTISFEAIEGEGMEDVEAVGNLRAATAVFHLNDDAWMTKGRAIFNLNPLQAIEHYNLQLETVE
ncbi:MAG: hypothetical protein COA78_31480 [Blastopirellula sp.]|nr:MAG: hypothetical protein COA78_31480 [Blastopirellula sp.]